MYQVGRVGQIWSAPSGICREGGTDLVNTSGTCREGGTDLVSTSGGEDGTVLISTSGGEGGDRFG